MDAKVKPFLRWAGGKQWLLKYCDEIVTKKAYNHYFEPFLGGGAMFFHLNPSKSTLSDLNVDLINTYRALQGNVTKVISVLESYENTSDFYYSLRNQHLVDKYDKAARFIFLNQTSFNGIYRVNLKGQYNVPYGYRTKAFIEKDLLLDVSERLQDVTLCSGDFTCIKKNIRAGDLVFLDPPYTVSNSNSGFIKYNQKIFSIRDQERLSKLVDYIKDIGACYVLTNAADEYIEELFDKGDRLLKKNRSSVIGGKNARRGLSREYIFTNI